jgi:hypothetical protein
MFVVRIKTTDGDLDFKAFSARPPARTRFYAAHKRIPADFDETALFEVASTDNARVAIDMVKAGKAALLEIYPEPMTKEQAEAFLAELGL